MENKINLDVYDVHTKLYNLDYDLGMYLDFLEVNNTVDGIYLKKDTCHDLLLKIDELRADLLRCANIVDKYLCEGP